MRGWKGAKTAPSTGHFHQALLNGLSAPASRARLQRAAGADVQLPTHRRIKVGIGKRPILKPPFCCPALTLLFHQASFAAPPPWKAPPLSAPLRASQSQSRDPPAVFPHRAAAAHLRSETSTTELSARRVVRSLVRNAAPRAARPRGPPRRALAPSISSRFPRKPFRGKCGGDGERRRRRPGTDAPSLTLRSGQHSNRSSNHG